MPSILHVDVGSSIEVARGLLILPSVAPKRGMGPFIKGIVCRIKMGSDI
jgi:hypothetical protein